MNDLPFNPMHFLPGLLCPLFGFAVVVVIIVTIVRALARSGGGGGGGIQPSLPNVVTQLGADGFWIVSCPAEPGSIVHYHFWTGGGEALGPGSRSSLARTGDNSSIRGPGRSRLPLSASWNHPMACSLILYRPSWGPQPPSSARPRMTNPIRPAARPRPRRSHPPTSAATGLLYLWACHGTTDILIPWKRRELYSPSPRPSPQRRGRTIRRVATNRGISACSATHDGAPSPQGRGLG
jgi:hypothetical protein